MTATADKIQAIIDHGQTMHLERLEAMRVLWTNLLARKHPFLLGPPGTNKSRLVRWMHSSIVGPGLNGEEPVLWEQLFNNQLSLDDIFGPIDMVAFDREGKWHRKPDGYLPTAHIAFGDEQFKANGTIINPMLAVLADFLAHINSQPVSVPLLCYVMASNEISDDPTTSAFWDRRGCALQLDYISETANVVKLFEIGADPRRWDQAAAAAVAPTVTLAELQRAVFAEVPAVTVTQEVKDLLLALKLACDHPSDGGPRVNASDRRWVHGVHLLQATAYLDGRDSVDEEDLDVLRHFLWETTELVPTVNKRVLNLSNPHSAKAQVIIEELDEIRTKIDEMRGQSVQARGRYGVELVTKLNRYGEELDSLSEKATASGRSARLVDQATARVQELRQTVLVALLNVPEEQARQVRNSTVTA